MELSLLLYLDLYITYHLDLSWPNYNYLCTARLVTLGNNDFV